MQQLTLSYPVRENAVCLGYKGRGLGKGYWNGFGGKVNDGEQIEVAAVRELKEETTIDVEENDLEKVAVIEFIFENGQHLKVHAFFVTEWSGVITETEEMRDPTWYLSDQIPYQEMWADDVHWLPRALNGERLYGIVYFDHTDANIKDMEWRALRDLDH